jgi:alpha-beta hydrolase superfamily lysophospholipase
VGDNSIGTQGELDPFVAARRDTLTILQSISDRQVPVLLGGMCLGADVAYDIVAMSDEGVDGAVLVNPTFSAGDTARLDEARRSARWRLRIGKLRRWRSSASLISGIATRAKSVRERSDRHERTYQLLRRTDAMGAQSLRLIFASQSHTLLHFGMVAGELGLQGASAPVVIPSADHVFTPIESQVRLCEEFCEAVEKLIERR